MIAKLSRSTVQATLITIIIVLTSLVLVMPTAAQERVVSDDEVNAIAGKLYCPVCENIPLDTCGTAACRDWREEIRSQLESGMSEEQVITTFVARYGDRVVGTPIDPMLRALSLVIPWVLGAIILLGALWTFSRWRGRQTTAPGQPETTVSADLTGTVKDDDYYRARLEQDLQSIR